MSQFLGFFKDGVESTLLMDIPEEDEDGHFEEQIHTSKVFPKEGMSKNQNEDHSKALLSQTPKVNGNGMNDEETINWIEKVLMGEQLFDSFSQKTYVCILLDLLAYNHLSLNNKAFDLLMKFFNQRANIIDLLKQVQLLEQPESIKILKKATKISSELKTFIEMINQWVDDGTNNISLGELSVRMISCKENIEYMTSVLVENPKQLKRALMDAFQQEVNTSFEVIPGTGRSQEESLVIGLNGKIKQRQELSKRELTPNYENQRLIRNLGIHEILITLLKVGLTKNQKTNSDYHELINTVYLFLIRFCSDNPNNQNLLGENIDLFAKELDSSPLAIFLIKEIFRNNKHFLTTKGQSAIRYIVQREEKMDIDSIEKHHYLLILKSFAKCKKKIVKKNQTEILMYIASYEEGRI